QTDPGFLSGAVLRVTRGGGHHPRGVGSRAAAGTGAGAEAPGGPAVRRMDRTVPGGCGKGGPADLTEQTNITEPFSGGSAVRIGAEGVCAGNTRLGVAEFPHTWGICTGVEKIR